jgi:hypothetical protein
MLRIKNFALVIFAVSIFLILPQSVLAAPISEFQARLAVSNWLTAKTAHFGENLGEAISAIKLYRGGQYGNIGYYLILLEPLGWVIVPADDKFSPIQSFGGGEVTFDSFERSFWHDTTYFGDTDTYDNASLSRGSASRGFNTTDKTSTQNRKTWKSLLSSAQTNQFNNQSRSVEYAVKSGDEIWIMGNKAANIWVGEFMGNEKYWGKDEPFNKDVSFLSLVSDDQAEYAANYSNYRNALYENSYKAGCVPVVTGQIACYLLNTKYPGNAASLSPLPAVYREITITNEKLPANKTVQIATKKKNSTYYWGEMSSFYDTNTASINPAVVHSKIAPLLRDLGVLINAGYGLSFTNSNGITMYSTSTGSDIDKTSYALKNIGFYAASAINLEARQDHLYDTTLVPNIINTNLDLGHPVGIGISKAANAASSDNLDHAVIVDGYAYYGNDIGSFGAPFYHVITNNNYIIANTTSWDTSDWEGWSMRVNAPINPSISLALSVRGFMYNVFPFQPKDKDNNGIANPAIISGRFFAKEDKKEILPSNKQLTVTAKWDNNSHQVDFNSLSANNGVYALVVEAS